METKRLVIRINQMWFENIILLFLVASVFMIPDINVCTYIGRISSICLLFYRLIKTHKARHRFFFIWAILFSAIVIMNVFISIDANLSMGIALSTLTAIWASYSVCDWLLENKNYSYVFNMIVFSEIVFCARLLLALDLSVWGQRKVGTMLGINVNTIGIRCVLAIVVALYLFYKIQNKKKILYIIAILICEAVILLTGSRRALILSVIAISCFVVLNSKNSLRVLKNIVFVFGTIVVLYYLVMNIPQLYAVLGERLNSFISGLFINDASAFDDGRDIMAETAISLFLEKPLTGWGMGCFSVNSGISIAYSHNNYAELLYATGIFGMAIYYSYVPYLICKLKRLSICKLEFIMVIVIIIILLLSDFAAVNYSTLFTILFIGFLMDFEALSSDVFIQSNDGKGGV